MARLIKNRKQISPLPESGPSLPVKIFASGIFSGYVPYASGTLSSAIAAACYFIPRFEAPIILAITIVLFFIAGVKASSEMEKKYGHDPAEVTIDEITGMWISLFLLPKTITVVFISFIFFRFFDIVKFFPANIFDRKKGGLYIMLDDVIAGIYSNILTHLLLTIPGLNIFLLR